MLVFIWMPGLYGQELAGESDEAENAFSHLEYAKAASYYEKIPERDQSIHVMENLATCYYKIKDYSKAVYALKRVLLLYPSDDQIRFKYADAIQHMGNYEFALSQYQFISPGVQDLDGLVKERIQSCKEALRIKSNSNLYKVDNDSLLNTVNSEFSIALSRDGVVFASDRPIPHQNSKNKKLYGWTNTHYVNLFESKRKVSGVYDSAKIFSKELLDEFHTSNAVLSADQNTVFFTRTVATKNPKKFFNENVNRENFVNRLQLFYAKKVNGKWGQVQSFSYNKPSEYSVAHPSLSLDGHYLYFASDMPGGKGGIDLYYSEIPTESGIAFGKPINLGDSINTSGNEEFPVIGLNNMLYYSSDGRIGLGGLDIFQAKGSLINWSSPQNLGSPVNSSMDDFGFIPTDVSAQAGFFTSNRPGGKGADDIYTFTRLDVKPLDNAHLSDDFVLADSNLNFLGKIVNGETGEVVPQAYINIVLLDSNQVKESLSDQQGNFKFVRGVNKKYFVKIKKPNFFTFSDTLRFGKKGELLKRTDIFKLSPIIVNKTIRLENIYYNFNSWEILPQAAGILNGLVKILKDNPEIEINLDSHTDTRGDFGINKYISKNRAQAAVSYLISKGIKSSRLSARGFGKEKPIVRCDNGYTCSESDHQLNRRTEFSVTKIVQNIK